MAISTLQNSVTQCQNSATLSIPLKKSECQKFSGIFRDDQKETLKRDGLAQHVEAPLKYALHNSIFKRFAKFKRLPSIPVSKSILNKVPSLQLATLFKKICNTGVFFFSK